MPGEASKSEEQRRAALAAERGHPTPAEPTRAQPAHPARDRLLRLLRPTPEPREAPARWETLRRDTVYRRALGVADIVAAAAALVLTIPLLGGDAVEPTLIAAVPLVVVVAKIIGLYDRDEHLLHKTTLEEAPALFQVSTLYTLLIWLGENALIDEPVVTTASTPLGRMQVLGLWGALFLSMLVARAGARAFARGATAPERCLVLGAVPVAKHISRKLDSARTLDATVVGRVPLELADRGGDGPKVVGELSGLPELVHQHAIDRVIIAPTTSESQEVLDAIQMSKALGVKVSVLPRFFDVVGSAIRFDDVEGMLLLGVPQWGLSKSSRVLKRSLDLVISTLGLILVAPLLAAIAIAVKLTSPGPVFFRQPRIGRDGRVFQITKFRTMFDGADAKKSDLLELNEADGLFKIANDPRLTTVGRVLRRFSLDELPQLFNVLRGDMSVVGPRPLVTDDDRLIEGWNRQRLAVPPGMTGIWQVLGSSRIPLHEMVKMDYLYAANWSIWLDLKVLLRTIPHVLGRRGL